MRLLLGARAARRLHLDLSRDHPVAGVAVGGLRVTGHEHRIDDISLGGVGIGPLTFDVSTRDLPGTDLLLGQDFPHEHRIFLPPAAPPVVRSRFQPDPGCRIARR